MTLKRIFRMTAVAAGLICMMWTAQDMAARKKDVEATDGKTFMTMKYKGEERQYLLYIPDSLAAGKPLVIMLHGYTRNAEPERFGMRAAAEKYGFILCNPQGGKDAKGKPGWNVGYPVQEGLKTDDVGFISQLANYIVKKYKLDKDNVFLAGHSNGGDMCYLFAYSNPGVFKAYASLAGLTLEWMSRQYDAEEPVPFMEVHGTADRTSRWAGDPKNEGGWGKYLSVPMAVGYMAALNKCTYEVTESVPSEKGKKIILHRYMNGLGGNEVWLYEIVDGKHSWPVEEIDCGEQIWRFFSKYISE